MQEQKRQRQLIADLLAVEMNLGRIDDDQRGREEKKAGVAALPMFNRGVDEDETKKRAGGKIKRPIRAIKNDRARLRHEKEAIVHYGMNEYDPAKAREQYVTIFDVAFRSALEGFINSKRQAQDGSDGKVNHEVEVTFGRMDTKSPTDIKYVGGLLSNVQFENVKKMLTSTIGIQYKITNMVKDIYNSNGSSIIKTDVRNADGTLETSYMRKTRDELIVNRDWGLKASKSIEEKLGRGAEDDIMGMKLSTTRDFTRYSFTDDSNEKLRGLVIDLSEVRERNHLTDKTYRNFELEIEVVNVYAYEPAVFVSNIHDICVLLFRAIYGIDGTMCYPEYIMTQEEHEATCNYHNGIVNTRKNIIIGPHKLFSDYWGKPKNLELRDLIDPKVRAGTPRLDVVGKGNFRDINAYQEQIGREEKNISFPVVTIKYDGLRMFLMTVPNQTQNVTSVYLLYPPFTMSKVLMVHKLLPALLIDGEYMKVDNRYEYHAFDIVYHEGKNLAMTNFLYRLHELHSYTKLLQELPELRYHVKHYYKDGDFFSNMKEAYEASKRLKGYAIDGFILQPANVYRSDLIKKWKPVELNTIDFLVRKRDNVEGEYDLFLYEKKEKDTVFSIFRGTRNFPLVNYVYKGPSVFEGRDIDKRVIEFKWDLGAKQFVIYRFRDDKQLPNYVDVGKSVWNDINNPINIETLLGQDLVLMRKYHNMIKENILEGLRGPVLVDIGSGRGGDLMKWNKNRNIQTVYAIEPNAENMAILLDRMKSMDMKKKVVVINKGIQETASVVDAIRKDDASVVGSVTDVVAFFSLTYLASSRDVFKSFIETIAKLVKKGGRFVGICMDGDAIRQKLNSERQRLKVASDYGAKIVQPAFNIEQDTLFEQKDKINERTGRYVFSLNNDNAFGYEITININDPTSMVHDQKEWLMYFSVLEAGLHKCGFTLDRDSAYLLDGNTPLQHINQMFNLLPEDAKLFSSMNRYFSFTRVDQKDPVWEKPKAEKKTQKGKKKEKAENAEENAEEEEEDEKEVEEVPAAVPDIAGPRVEKKVQNEDEEKSAPAPEVSIGDDAADVKISDAISHALENLSLKRTKYLPYGKTRVFMDLDISGEEEKLVRLGMPDCDYTLLLSIMMSVSKKVNTQMEPKKLCQIASKVQQKLASHIKEVHATNEMSVKKIKEELISGQLSNNRFYEQLLSKLLKINILFFSNKGGNRLVQTDASDNYIIIYNKGVHYDPIYLDSGESKTRMFEKEFIEEISK